METDAWGIDDGWEDTTGLWHPAPEATITAIRTAMGGDPAGPPPAGRPAWVVRPGATEPLLGPCHLSLEDGADVGEVTTLPGDLPLGIHSLTPCDGGPVTSLVVSPGRCHLPGDLWTWGVTMQVPTTRSRASWGVGDLVDVGHVAAWVAGLGGGALALSPVHAPTPVSPLQPSPYYPSSRVWRSPLLLRVDALPGGDAPEIAALSEQARALLSDPLVRRDAAWEWQRQALEVLWARGPGGTPAPVELLRWRSEQGDALECWARFCALAEQHGGDWRRWPPELRHPESPAVAATAGELAGRVSFHAWLQWLLDRQLRDAGDQGVRLVQDLAIGADPGGFDAWRWQDLLAGGCRIGAPPDDFAPDGQSWGLPPFIPWRLRDAGYRPLADLLRASLVVGGGLRVDHVMGLVRLFWIPEGGDPADGTYVRFAGRELLEVLAMESARAGAVVVGEDLGTVEAGFREELAERGLLSTRLVWFEDDPPERYPSQALAMVTTHDLPTVTGLWSGADESELASLGRPSPPEEARRVRDRVERLVPLSEGAPASQVVAALHSRLGRSAAQLALATLEDLCGVAERVNVPGTMDERPNWSRALPVLVDDLATDPSVAAAVTPLAEARRGY